MATSETVLEKATTLASLRMETDDAVEELLAVCGSNRVAVVQARREISQRAEEEPGNPSLARALALLDETLRLGQWDVA